MRRLSGCNDHASARKAAFTLIEILSVLAIIGLLAAIVLPVLASARERGRQSACLSNMHQVGLAIAQYISDDDGVYPSGDPADPEWTSQVSPYLKSVAVFRCPSDPTQPQSNTPGAFVDSYAINTNLLALLVGGVPAVPDAALTAPPRTVMLFEVSNSTDNFEDHFPGQNGAAAGNGSNICDGNFVDGFFPCGTGATQVTIDGLPWSQPLYATANIGGRMLNGDYGGAPRHSGGSNYVACDGHAKWLRPEDVSSGGVAASSSCSQGGGAAVPLPACIKNIAWRFAAEGTGFAGHQLTFSTR